MTAQSRGIADFPSRSKLYVNWYVCLALSFWQACVHSMQLTGLCSFRKVLSKPTSGNEGYLPTWLGFKSLFRFWFRILHISSPFGSHSRSISRKVWCHLLLFCITCDLLLLLQAVKPLTHADLSVLYNGITMTCATRLRLSTFSITRICHCASHTAEVPSTKRKYRARRRENFRRSPPVNMQLSKFACTYGPSIIPVHHDRDLLRPCFEKS